jgi:hypothetical protein
MTDRYEIRNIRGHRNGTFGIWDTKLNVWQDAKTIREDAEAWIAERLIADKNPKPSTLNIRMPLKD